MTGRDLIIYILENHLEDEQVLKDGKLLGFMTVNEAAVKFNVGPETIKLWFDMKVIKGFKLGEELYILMNQVKVLKGVV